VPPVPVCGRQPGEVVGGGAVAPGGPVRSSPCVPIPCAVTVAYFPRAVCAPNPPNRPRPCGCVLQLAWASSAAWWRGRGVHPPRKRSVGVNDSARSPRPHRPHPCCCTCPVLYCRPMRLPPSLPRKGVRPLHSPLQGAPRRCVSATVPLQRLHCIAFHLPPPPTALLFTSCQGAPLFSFPVQLAASPPPCCLRCGRVAATA